MKKFLHNKKIIITTISILIVSITVGSVYAINLYTSHVIEQNIKKSISAIDKKYNNFKNESNRDKKIGILESLEDENNRYKSSDHTFQQMVKNKYEKSIEQMKNYFKEEYQLEIKNNTLNDLDKINDKNKITSSKNSLNSLLKKIDGERGIVCTKDEIESYDKTIKDLMNSYDERIKKIKEDEEKAKKEAEEKAKKEAEEKKKEAEKNIDSNQKSDQYLNDNNKTNDYSNDNNVDSNSNDENGLNNAESSDQNINSNESPTVFIWTDENGDKSYFDGYKHWNDHGDVYYGDCDGWYSP